MSFSLLGRECVYIDSREEIKNMYSNEFEVPLSQYFLEQPYDLRSRGKKRKRKNYDQSLLQQNSQISQELDLQKIIQQQNLVSQILKIQKQELQTPIKKLKTISTCQKNSGKNEDDPSEVRFESDVDWILMNKFKGQIKPKFLWENELNQAKNLFNNFICNDSGGNKIGFAGEKQLVIPEGSRFEMSNLEEMRVDDKKFNIILMDPPWENKSVHHQRPYQSLTNKDLFQLPINRLSCKDNCSVFIWVTNRPKIINFVKEELLPHWNLTYYTTWFWIKITRIGEFIYDLESTHKKTYEKLIVAYSGSSSSSFKQIHQNLNIWSVPGQHSTKPLLNNFLGQFCPQNGACVELFARNLAKGWTSWGNEVLKFQELDTYLVRKP